MTALIKALLLAITAGLTFALVPLFEDGIRAAFGFTLTACRWIQANPERFTFFAILAFAIMFVWSVNRANARNNQTYHSKSGKK